ncbi:phosphomannomutase [Anaeromyxobacter oryzae]|uniref:Phosphomannomutase n=1 Tax=Anaeromyxobacter oryzae TaxID=2918170 RepID=A0ABN6MUT5_9BACT|nr:phosphomannomutase [Anaeromyxobacter oryzae]BDG03450.1 phosphomannomutase [Anaeromyxobacter oryzae]
MKLAVSELARVGVGFGTSGVRGKVDALSDRACFAYTLAFLEHLSRSSPGGPHTVALAHDLRPSSPRITAACAAAAHSLGWRVVFLGAIPTPALAHYAIQSGVPAIVITGSHIPFDRNGIKFYTAQGEILKADEAAIAGATVDLDDAAFDGDALRSPPALGPVEPAGRELYRRRYLGFFPAGMLGGRRIGVYQHSSVARDLLKELLAALGADVVPLGRTDTFVPVDTEAVSEADQLQARRWSAEHRLDAIVSTDGDADRPLVADERGTWLRGDVVGLLCAGFAGADVVVTPVSSNTAVERWGRFSRVERTRIGSPYVIEAMQQAVRGGARCVVGYEANGGFLVGSDLVRTGDRAAALAALPTRDAVLPILSVLALAAERSGPVSAVTADLPRRYTHSDRIQEFETARSRTLLDRLGDPAVLARFLAPVGTVAAVNRVDGVRVTLASGDVVHLRPSGNAPELRCYAESDAPEKARELCAWGLRQALASA